MNDQQQAAALAPEGFVQIVAGPGTGKTFTLVQRIATLLRRGISPEHMLIMTFTNAAASELRERAAKLVPGAEKLDVGTFHSIAYQYLRKNSPQGVPRLTIVDEWDKRDILKELGSTRLGEDAKAISKARVSGRSDGRRALTEIQLDLLGRYELWLQTNHKTDFDGLLLLWRDMLQKSDKPYPRPWKAVLVDEFQDTNEIQLDITMLLTNGPQCNNCTIVGDPDQSIYKFRNAEPRNFSLFKHSVEESGQTVLMRCLEWSYRSNAGIIDQASRLIAGSKNRFQSDRVLRPAPDAPQAAHRKPKPQLQGCSSQWEQARVILRQIDILTAAGVRLGEIAVLSRMSRDLEVIESAMASKGIRVRILGGRRLADRRDVKMILSYLAVAVDETDYIAVKRTINEPKRGVGAATLDSLYADYGKGDIKSALVPLKELANRKHTQQSAKIQEYLDSIAHIRALSIDTSQGIAAAIMYIYDKVIGVKTERGTNPADILCESVASFEPLEPTDGDEGVPLLSQFLGRWALSSEKPGTESQDVLTLSTVHSAKGLEWPVVFLADANEGKYDTSDIDEALRVWYVALTRPKALLFILWDEKLSDLSPLVAQAVQNGQKKNTLRIKSSDLDAVATAVKRPVSMSLANNNVMSKSTSHAGGEGGADPVGFPRFIPASDLPQYHSPPKPQRSSKKRKTTAPTDLLKLWGNAVKPQ